MSRKEYEDAPKFICLYRDKKVFNGKFVIREVIKSDNYPAEIYQYMEYANDDSGSGHLIRLEEILHIEPKQDDSIERITKLYAEYLI